MIASARHTILLLAILAALTIATYAANSSRPSGAHMDRVALYASIAVGEWLLARYIVAGLKTITARELIGTFRWFDVPLAAAFYFGSRFILLEIQRALGPAPSRMGGLMPVTTAEKIAWIAVSITAGFVEELTFRGYLQRQFVSWTHSNAAAIATQAIVFAVAHSYQGVKPTIAIFVFAVLFGALAHYRRSLVPGMVAHACTDIVGGLLRG